jgi:hypothetical protein
MGSSRNLKMQRGSPKCVAAGGWLGALWSSFSKKN